jgi:hypothetical protein
MRPYQEQFRRVVRCLNKIEKETGDRVEYEDDLWSFFQNCWHLKDWIRYDPTLRGRAIRKEIEKKVKHTKYLEICADTPPSSQPRKIAFRVGHARQTVRGKMNPHA